MSWRDPIRFPAHSFRRLLQLILLLFSPPPPPSSSSSSSLSSSPPSPFYSTPLVACVVIVIVESIKLIWGFIGSSSFSFFLYFFILFSLSVKIYYNYILTNRNQQLQPPPKCIQRKTRSQPALLSSLLSGVHSQACMKNQYITLLKQEEEEEDEIIFWTKNLNIETSRFCCILLFCSLTQMMVPFLSTWFSALLSFSFVFFSFLLLSFSFLSFSFLSFSLVLFFLLFF